MYVYYKERIKKITSLDIFAVLEQKIKKLTKKCNETSFSKRCVQTKNLFNSTTYLVVLED